jgi:head-tail adaptor
MKSGKLRHVITIQQATTTINAGGTPVQTWGDLYTLRAELMAEVAVESTNPDAGAEDLETMTFHARFAPGISNAMRLIFRGEAMNIKRIMPMRNDREMQIEAQKIGGID